MKVIIVCHTEFGFVINRHVVFSKEAVAGATKGAMRLVCIADKYNAKITFAVTPETAKHIPKIINHEIGLHTHPGWEEFEVQGIKYVAGDNILKDCCKKTLNDSTIMTNHSYQSQLEMIEVGRDYLEDVFGIVPQAHVAGRWAINEDTVKALEEAGFTHDCSVLPHIKQPNYDYSELPRVCKPYYVKDVIYNRNILIELPVSMCFPSGIASPESISLFRMKLTFLEYYYRKQPVFHICLHSPCMTDDYYVLYVDNLLKFISGHDIEFVFASEAG